MQKTITIKLLPSEAADEQTVKRYIANSETVSIDNINGYQVLKSSIDARGRQAWINMQVLAYIGEPAMPRQVLPFQPKDLNQAKYRVIIIGAGPAGLFAALKLAEAGIKPIILERGKEIRARRRDLAILNKEGEVNPESNYCFGEGGAGTYSDGKLYTRSSKRGDISRILQLFVHFGADERILYEAHPHIGTNKLPQIITAMREALIDCGAEIHFNKKFTGIQSKDGIIQTVSTADGDKIHADAVILATGHSARDIFELFHQNNWLIEAKPFALGVRVEHPQQLIDQSQYHCETRNAFLPPASYSLVQQVDGRGVFSFCMCPGGIIAPAATSPGELVVNGWSPSKRNNPYANSGIVVTIDPADAIEYFKTYKSRHKKIVTGIDDQLLLLKFQQAVEQRAFDAGGGKFVAPAQRLTDFTENKRSASLPGCSYLPGIHEVPLDTVLPPFVSTKLKLAFREFGKKIKGYYSSDAVVVATESRTSSPVRIPRDNILLSHPQFENLYPCGEGAGYAGGIVSAAMDGERVASVLAQKWQTV